MKPLVLKNALFKVQDLITFGVCGFTVWQSQKGIELGTLVLIALACSLLAIYLFRIFNRKVQITIDQRGITEHGQQTIPWSKIQYAFVIYEVDRDDKTGFFANECFLKVITPDQDFEMELDKLQYSEAEIKAAVEHFSKRRIGEYQVAFEDEVLDILEDYAEAHEIKALFDQFRRTWAAVLIVSIVFFALVCVAIAYFTQFYLSIILVYGIACFSIPFLLKKQLLQFKMRPKIAHLSEGTFKLLAHHYEFKLYYLQKQELNYLLIGFGFVFLALSLFMQFA